MKDGVPVVAILACTRAGVVGHGGGLPWRIPSDLQRFKRLTMGHVMVMGRATWESIGKPLPGRVSVVVSSTLTPADLPPGVRVGALDVALGEAAVIERRLRAEDGGEACIFLIGGARLWRAAWDVVDAVELTWVEADVAGDTVFDLGLLEGFVETRSEAVAATTRKGGAPVPALVNVRLERAPVGAPR